jgi:hypothetical protein
VWVGGNRSREIGFCHKAEGEAIKCWQDSSAHTGFLRVLSSINAVFILWDWVFTKTFIWISFCIPYVKFSIWKLKMCLKIALNNLIKWMCIGTGILNTVLYKFLLRHIWEMKETKFPVSKFLFSTVCAFFLFSHLFFYQYSKKAYFYYSPVSFKNKVIEVRDIVKSHTVTK